MPLLKGLTAAQAIAELQKLDPKAVLVLDDEFGCHPIKTIRAGLAVRSHGESNDHNGCLFCDEDDELPESWRQRQPAITFEC